MAVARALVVVQYCYFFRAGPTEESNWVIPGRVLVGAYPSSLEDKLNAEILTSILKLGQSTCYLSVYCAGTAINSVYFCVYVFAGITTFVCLQQGEPLESKGNVGFLRGSFCNFVFVC